MKDKRTNKKIRKLLRKHKIRPDKRPNKTRDIPNKKKQLNCQIEGKPVFFDGKLLWFGRAATKGIKPDNPALWIELFQSQRTALRDALMNAGYTAAAGLIDTE